MNSSLMLVHPSFVVPWIVSTLCCGCHSLPPESPPIDLSNYLESLVITTDLGKGEISVFPCGIRVEGPSRQPRLILDIALIGPTDNVVDGAIGIIHCIKVDPRRWVQLIAPSGTELKLRETKPGHGRGYFDKQYSIEDREGLTRTLLQVRLKTGMTSIVEGKYRVRLQQRPEYEIIFRTSDYTVDDSWHEFALLNARVTRRPALRIRD